MKYKNITLELFCIIREHHGLFFFFFVGIHEKKDTNPRFKKESECHAFISALRHIPQTINSCHNHTLFTKRTWHRPFITWHKHYMTFYLLQHVSSDSMGSFHVHLNGCVTCNITESPPQVCTTSPIVFQH